MYTILTFKMLEIYRREGGRVDIDCNKDDPREGGDSDKKQLQLSRY